jgi:hypothetical protein
MLTAATRLGHQAEFSGAVQRHAEEIMQWQERVEQAHFVNTQLTTEVSKLSQTLEASVTQSRAAATVEVRWGAAAMRWACKRQRMIGEREGKGRRRPPSLAAGFPGVHARLAANLV